jgi:hypothetical protein
VLGYFFARALGRSCRVTFYEHAGGGAVFYEQAGGRHFQCGRWRPLVQGYFSAAGAGRWCRVTFYEHPGGGAVFYEQAGGRHFQVQFGLGVRTGIRTLYSASDATELFASAKLRK